MLIQHFEIALLIFYLSLVAGVFFKFIKDGVRGVLLILSMFVPLIIFILPIIAAAILTSPRFSKNQEDIDFINNEKRRVGKIVFTFELIYVTTKSFPHLIGIIGKGLSVLIVTTKDFNLTEIFIPLLSFYSKNSNETHMKFV